VLGTVFVVILFVTVFAGAVLLVLSPGIIINWMRGRYKGRPEGVIKASVRDWQTWLISLPIAAAVLFVLNLCGVFNGPVFPARTHPSSEMSQHDAGSTSNDKQNTVPGGALSSVGIGFRHVIPAYTPSAPQAGYLLSPGRPLPPPNTEPTNMAASAHTENLPAKAEKKPVREISKEEWIKLHQEP